MKFSFTNTNFYPKVSFSLSLFKVLQKRLIMIFLAVQDSSIGDLVTD